MQRSLIRAVLAVMLAVASANCRDRDDEVGRAAAARDSIEVTGCLTANQATNQFVLTANATPFAASGATDTYTYQLAGGTNLQEHVGREVVVRGSLEGGGDEINMQTKSKSEQPPRVSRGEEVTPAVESKEVVELEVRKLNVASVTPTGSACHIAR